MQKVALLLLVCLAGCGYSLAGRGSFLPASIKVIAVPLFTNNTNVFELERRVTDKVRGELSGRGKYRVEASTTRPHDAVLSGVITSVTLAPSAFNTAGQATRYVLTLTANVELKTAGEDGKVIWGNPSLQFREEYDVTSSTQASDAAAFLGNDVNALERLATEFARSVISAMLEAF
jgi:outer membrane lipopolysaccharide assembly protein LptE/RlpB